MPSQPVPDCPNHVADGLLHGFFERAAARYPDRIAIDSPPSSGQPERRRICYGDLDCQANALAARLQAHIHATDSIVVILLPRDSEHLYLAQLAVLKAGAAHACLDPLFPDGQLLDVFRDAQPVAILTNASGVARLATLPHQANLVLDVPTIPRHPARPQRPSWLTPASLAYLIYTSGTTGRPKGVMIEHRAIANLVAGDLAVAGITPDDRVGQSSSCAYDSSVEETWFALAAGATLVVMDDEVTRLGPDLVGWLQRERVSVFCPTPTLLRTTGCDDPHIALPQLRLLHVGGEALPVDVAARWGRGRVLVNDYGPTECSVTALRGAVVAGRTLTIGRPVPGISAWVVDERLEPVQPGEQGELCLGGVGLARGYHHLPELTARKFPTHPQLGRIYRTGDLVSQEMRSCGAYGEFLFHGRIDAQVKIRGYRIELEAIEARLSECAGVREAICRVQGEGTQQRLVAFIVPNDPTQPPAFSHLKDTLRQTLPEYMVPTQFGILESLPRSVSGKLNRQALPLLARPEEDRGRPPATPLEMCIAQAFQAALGWAEVVPVHLDFFHDLGGNSLLAARVISMLRQDSQSAALTVRDLYVARSVEELAKRATPVQEPPLRDGPRQGRSPVPAGLIQALWLLAALVLSGPITYVGVTQVVTELIQTLGLLPFLLMVPLFVVVGLTGYALVSVTLVVTLKWILIGRYRPLRAPVWGSFYVRNWMVQQAARLVPWRWLEGTIFQQFVLRALGARIGRRVHIHRGVNLLSGGWDLLDIGDEVTLSQDSAVRLVELEDGEIVVGAVVLERGCVLDIRSGVAGQTRVGANAHLTPLSFLPRGGTIPAGERWDGVPAAAAGSAVWPAPTTPDLGPLAHGSLLTLARIGLGLFLAIPLEILALVAAWVLDGSEEGLVAWIAQPTWSLTSVLVIAALVLLALPLGLVFQVLALRLLGRVGPGVVSRWGVGYVRIWLKSGLVESASTWLSGTLFWPVWLRCAGMAIGRGCEVSTISDVLPELVTIGEESFFADGIYLGGPKICQGSVTLAPVVLGRNTFLGNHAIILAGQTLPADILVGICTVADQGQIRPASSWFGHPPFELPRREVVEVDRSWTHNPTWLRWCNRLIWELLRFTLPVGLAALTFAWFVGLSWAAAWPVAVVALVAIPLLDGMLAAVLCLLVLGAKWGLLGRVRPGQHALWSCWCSRWDFLYVIWDIYARGPLGALEGTPFLTWYLRAMGMRIGRGVVLGGGFAHVVDPDMLQCEDGTTVSCLFQAHTFEDRVLKIDHVTIRRGATVGNSAVLLYGADIGAAAYVAPHSVVMKHERLLPGRIYIGCPTVTPPDASTRR